MTFLSRTLRKLLTDYKRLLKRYMTPEERTLSITRLKLDRKLLKQDNEVALYQKAQAIIEHINKDKAFKNLGAQHSGLELYREHLYAKITPYQIKGNTLINPARKASQAAVEAVQLIALPAEHLDEHIAKRLQRCITDILHLGSKEHHQTLSKALTRHKEKHPSFFLPLCQILHQPAYTL